MKTVITIAVLFLTSPHSEPYSVNRSIVRRAKRILEANLPVEIKIKKIIVDRNRWMLNDTTNGVRMLSGIRRLFGRHKIKANINIALIPSPFPITAGRASGYCDFRKGSYLFSFNKRWKEVDPYKRPVSTLLHEMAHSLGAFHDNSQPISIMNQLGGNSYEFSEKSKREILECLAR